MQRDFIGYADQTPKVGWPEDACIAVNFVLNYEEGSERNICDGDAVSEDYLTGLPNAAALKGERHLSVESLFEYGSRAGVWRLLRLFDEYKIPLTIFTTGLALERNPVLAKALMHSHHEISGHGYRWISYRNVSLETEKEDIAKTLKTIEQLVGRVAKGWYTGRKSIHTRQLIVEAGLLYDSDSYADDLPYWIPVCEKKHLIIPYNLDANDLRYATEPGWSDGIDFLNYLKASFNCLYREGKICPKILTIGLHARLSGHPGRCEALRLFIEYVRSFSKVWICKREEIADYWIHHQMERVEV